MPTLTDLPQEILDNIFNYLAPGCIEILDGNVVFTSTERPNFDACTRYNPDVDDGADALPADRSSIHRYLCNCWRKLEIDESHEESIYCQWQLQKEQIPGVGKHGPTVYDLAGLTKRGIDSIEKKAVCPCGYCQKRKIDIASSSTRFLAPLLVCKSLYFRLRTMVFEENIWAFLELAEMQQFLDKLAP